jgi:geranylgeranyl diphosphate synthase type I
MGKRSTTMQQWRRILEDKGGNVAEEAKLILLNDPALRDMKTPLEFISRNWHDPLRPALMALSCEAVGGEAGDTREIALAVSLMSLSFYLWDDIIDNAPSRLFKPTLYGKFDSGAALVIGGLASAKAFTILNQAPQDEAKRQAIAGLIWRMWAEVARAETVNLKSRNEKYSSKNKFYKMKTEAAANLETCMKIGAIVGSGSENEIKHLGKYGLCLGIILELQNDFRVSVNLTLELAQKIRTGALPYSLLWAREHSEKTRKILDNLAQKKGIKPRDVERIVKNVLETKALDRTACIIMSLTKKAEDELNELEKNGATQTLKSFVEAQPRLLKEILPASVLCET